MFVVYDCGKRAQYPEHNVYYTWNNASYDTKKDAAHYAHLWLGIHSPGKEMLENLNAPYDYSGYGSFLEIREEVE